MNLSSCSNVWLMIMNENKLSKKRTPSFLQDLEVNGRGYNHVSDILGSWNIDQGVGTLG